MISKVRILVLASLVGATALSSPARAQSFSSDTTARADSVAPSHAPTVANASVGVRAATLAPALQLTAGAKAPAFQARTSGRGSVALMIVGGAALLTGALIGDDAGTIIMVGGAAIGLYGLWQFLQ